MARSVTLEEYRYVMVTILLTMFICWTLQEIMERGLGMAPKITTAKDIHSQSHGKANPLKHYKTNKRLTKSLDHSGQFRIQTRGTIYFIKSIYQIILFITSLYVFCAYPQWFIDHFINLREDTVNFMPYLHISGSLVAFYAWEVVANRYGRLTWSVLVHHWFTAAVAAAILMGRYTPFATWYGFCLVSMDFPVFFTLGFRAQFSNKYPHFTRKAFLFSFCWWLFIIILNLCGQLFIIFNALIFHYNESIHVGFIVIMLFCIAAWLYDDIMLLRGLYDFSTHDYEDAEILNSDKRSMSRNLGGRALFAMSVIHDIETLKKLDEEEEDEEGGTIGVKYKNGKSGKVLQHITLHQMSSDPYLDPNAESEKHAKLEKHESLTNDDLHDIKKGVHSDSDHEEETDGKGGLKVDCDAPKLEEVQSKSPSPITSSPDGDAGDFAKMSPVDSGDLRDLIEIQKEQLTGAFNSSSSGSSSSDSEAVPVNVKSSRL